MGLKIEDGRYYRTRDGRKVGPMEQQVGVTKYPFQVDGGRLIYTEDGENFEGPESYYTLIAEWTDGPVRTVNRREIVPGVYGVVMVNERGDGKGIADICSAPTLNATELRAAAATFIELADALDEANQ